MNDGIFTCTICKKLRFSSLLYVMENSAEGLENLRKLGHLICGYCKAIEREWMTERAMKAREA